MTIVSNDSQKITADCDLSALAEAICEEHALAERHAELAIHRAKRAGDLLNTAKGKVAHGEWLPWLSANCPRLPARTASGYMRLAKNWEQVEAKSADSAVLTIDSALRLLSEPVTPTLGDRVTAINERANQLGECMTEVAHLVRKMRDGIGSHFGGFEQWCAKELGLDPALRDMLLDPSRRWHPSAMDEEQHTLLLFWVLRREGYSETEALAILSEEIRP
ncbi:MAG: DUF3102 domain-containing protein [Candidatus Competibacteraceae bacterium]|nr:MAG: DUF3102 domain-containing protein [Candidatus Competibacteraceae bacterium]